MFNGNWVTSTLSRFCIQQNCEIREARSLKILTTIASASSRMATSALATETDRNVLPWLQLAEELRMLNLDCELNMPQICVMGDQSSGKSSVLEALSGIPFPRGSGLVTRCPIRMVMRRPRHGSEWNAVVTTSKNAQQVVARDVNQLHRILEEKMEEVCQAGNNFSTDSVIVDLTSPDACDLTVVDLPGIIRTVTAGQSVDSIRQVNALIKQYLSDPRTMILAVIPANQDIATVDILERAQSVDPGGTRTIGVVTKADLVSPGGEEEVLSVINNIRKPLTLGYVLVKNRSQKDIQDNISTSRARELESEFFAKHPVFRRLQANQCGVAPLSKKLTQLLVQRIQQELVPMRTQVERLLTETRAELRLFPNHAFSSPADSASQRQKVFVSTVQTLVRTLSDSIRGEYRDRVFVQHPECRLYARAMQQFEAFQQSIQATAPPFEEDAFVEELSAQIEQFRGRELPGFMSSQAFYLCMSQYVSRWQPSVQELLTELRTVALNVTVGITGVLLAPYPALQDAVRDVASQVLQEHMLKAEAACQELVDRENDPFTLNEFLQQWVNKLRYEHFVQAVDKSLNDARHPVTQWQAMKEEVFVSMRQWYRATHAISATASAKEMASILQAYWHLAAKRFVDNVCMRGDKDLLGTLPEALQDRLFMCIQDTERLQVFFTESPERVQRRDELVARRDRLMQAAERLTTVSSTV